MKNIIIFGESGHGSVLLDCIEKEGKYNVIGFVDSFKQKGSKKNGYEILGSEYDLPYLTEKFNLYGGIIAIGDNWTRKIMVDKVTKIVPGFNFISTVHPSAIIGKDVIIGKGTAIIPGAIVNTNSVIGDHCIINTNSSLGHDGQMHDFSSLASGVCTGGNLILGKFSAVSLGTHIIENVSIGEHTVIGAGSLVVNSIQSHVVAYGAPARVKRRRMEGERYLNGSKRTAMLPFAANDF